jgi:hypothetical protein
VRAIERDLEPAASPDASALARIFGGSAQRRDLSVMSDIASARVAALFWKMPRTALVTVSAPAFLTPRIDMQRCSASMTTITPAGSRFFTIVSAIWEVSRSWT